jgi:succinate dehydrogenase/fumarate reductase flavoprotein subunit
MANGQQRDFDFLVIGSGIAGLWFALQVARRGLVAINRTNTTLNSIQHSWCAGSAGRRCSRRSICPFS